MWTNILFFKVADFNIQTVVIADFFIRSNSVQSSCLHLSLLKIGSRKIHLGPRSYLCFKILGITSKEDQIFTRLNAQLTDIQKGLGKLFLYQFLFI